MKSIAIFLLFLGTILIIQGYYNNIVVCPKPKTIIKYVPRNFYEDQLAGNDGITTLYQGMFDESQVRTIQ
jgi:hypothetical protein